MPKIAWRPATLLLAIAFGVVSMAACEAAASRSSAGADVATSAKSSSVVAVPSTPRRRAPVIASTPRSARPRAGSSGPAAHSSAPNRPVARRWSWLGPVVAVGRVSEVVDGDTVHVFAHGIDYDVRVLGIDTPETKDPRKPVQCWGPQASRFAEQHLAGERVTLRSDPSQERIDRYGRTLAYVIAADGTNYSLAAVKSGAARAYVYDAPVRLNPRLQAAETAARHAGRGLWGAPCHGQQTHRAPVAKTSHVPTHTQAPAGRCEPGYTPCLPVVPDLDCSDINGPVQVTGSDPYRLDADGDGIGCEG
jgi:micrococcal nuclease